MILRTHQLMVVDFTVITQNQVRILMDLERLHSLKIFHDSKTMETESAVFEVVDVLYTESIRASMTYTHT